MTWSPAVPTSPLRRRLTGFGLVCMILLVFNYFYLTPQSRYHLWSTGSSSLDDPNDLHFVTKGPPDVSIILLAGDHEYGMLEVVNSVFRMTFGSYGLIGVYPSKHSPAASHIAETLLRNHCTAGVDRKDRGLTGYRRMYVDELENDLGEGSVNAALKIASGEYTIILSGTHEITDYAWDRKLLTAIRSDPKLFAVSGRGGANIAQAASASSDVHLMDTKGDMSHGPHANSNVDKVSIHDIVIRSPLILRTKDVLDLGGYREQWESNGLGDMDLCLRGKANGLKCGYYPIATYTQTLYALNQPPWTETPVITTSPNPEELMELIESSGVMENGAYGDEGSDSVALADDPLGPYTTIVSTFSGNHQHIIPNLLESLTHDPFSRVIIYIMDPGGQEPINPALLERWKNRVDFRIFKFDDLEEWMNVNINAGEYAWKALMLEEVMNEFVGLVLWVDAGDRLTSDFGGHSWAEIAKVGVWTGQSDNTVADWTHPGMRAYFDVGPDILSMRNCNAAIIGFNTQNARAMEKVIRPWIACSHDRDCIAPPGSSRQNHRQDQAALTVLLRLHGFSCERTLGIDYHLDTHLGVEHG